MLHDRRSRPSLLLRHPLTTTLPALLVLLAPTALASPDLLITEVVDGTLSGGQPKWVELSNTGPATVDLAAYSLGVKSNGGSNLYGGAAHLLSGPLPPQTSFIISFESDGGPGGTVFHSVYGQDPDSHASSLINGDDVLLLYLGAASGDGSNALLVDSFGQEGVDGTGSAWEYTDSYAQRCGDQANAGLFLASDWNLPGPNALEDGCGDDDACEAATLAVLTNPWTHSGCSSSAPGTPYCLGDQGLCPCVNENDGSNGEAGCGNAAHPGGAALSATGTTSLTAADLKLHTMGLPSNRSSIYFQAEHALQGGAGLPFGDGLRCAGGSAIRIEIVQSDSAGLASTSIDLGAAGSNQPGDVRRYQHWYASSASGPCTSGFNGSNGYEITWSA